MGLIKILTGRIWRLIISREFTSLINYIIDNWIPAIIRDSRIFMYPFFSLAYKGKEVKKYMEFKSRYYALDAAGLEKMYENYNPIGMERETSLSSRSINYIFEQLGSEKLKILEIACGNGYLAARLADKGFAVTAADLASSMNISNVEYHRANIESLPFTDNCFDAVISAHTLEHVIDIRKAVKEIIRVARNKVIIILPCQRYFYYTLDLHLHFFPRKEMLVNLMGIDHHTITKIGRDWVYTGYLTE
jgi:SAM-dependent methyltransferase